MLAKYQFRIESLDKISTSNRPTVLPPHTLCNSSVGAYLHTRSALTANACPFSSVSFQISENPPCADARGPGSPNLERNTQEAGSNRCIMQVFFNTPTQRFRRSGSSGRTSMIYHRIFISKYLRVMPWSSMHRPDLDCRYTIVGRHLVP